MGTLVSAITETWDASAPVNGPAPAGTMGDHIDSLMGHCGHIIAGISWVVEEVTGRDLLEELLKPIAGDFHQISSMQAGWRQVQLATSSVGENYQNLSAQLAAVWEGEAQAAACSTLTRVAGSHERQAEAAGLIADQMGHMIEVSLATAELVCAVLEFIDSVVQEILLDVASGPLGWAKGAISAPGKARQLIRLINQGLDAISALVAAVKACVTAMKLLNALLDGANSLLGVINAGGHLSAGSHADDTARAGYGE